jgi:type II secretory pathway pseudopilin PulG
VLAAVLDKLTHAKKGFTYIELIVGMGILLSGVAFLSVMISFSSHNRIIGREQVSMAVTARNMAEVFLSTPGDFTARKAAAEAEGIEYRATVEIDPQSTGAYTNMNIIKISVEPKAIYTNFIDQPYILKLQWLY